MTAGKRDQLITIERATMTTDDYGAEVPTWGTYATEWAQVLYGIGVERRAAAVEQGQQAATFQMLSNALTRAVALKDRITHEGSTYDIRGVSPIDRATIELTAVRNP